MRLSRGTRLGHYEIIDPIGAGGMGEVYRAKDYVRRLSGHRCHHPETVERTNA